MADDNSRLTRSAILHGWPAIGECKPRNNLLNYNITSFVTSYSNLTTCTVGDVSFFTGSVAAKAMQVAARRLIRCHGVNVA